MAVWRERFLLVFRETSKLWLEQLEAKEPELAARVAGPCLAKLKDAAEEELYTVLWMEFSDGKNELDYDSTERLLRKFFKSKGFRGSATEIKSE